MADIIFLLVPVFSSPTVHENVVTELIPRDGRGSEVTAKNALKWYDPDLNRGANPRKVTKYTCYRGPASNFPKMSKWISFNDMWKIQKQYALAASNDTQTEINDMHAAIIKISKVARVDARVILAVIIHESFGNVHVPCTYSPDHTVHNCGLMQSFNASDTSYDPNHPLRSITQMIIDGTQGTAAGPGLVQQFNDAPDTNKQTNGNVYKVFRAYNSGSVNQKDLSDGYGALNSYVSDMANYLQGWNGYGNGPSLCNFTVPTPTAPVCSPTAFVPPPTQTASGTTPDCCTWYTVKSGNTCDVIDSMYGITLQDFLTWNTNINQGCTNLIVDYAYCVSSNLTVSTSTSTTSSSSTSTTTPTHLPAPCSSPLYVPAPTQTLTGTTPDCCTWYTVQSGDYCYLIDQAFNITLAEFEAWNTEVGDSCSVYPDYAYCVDSDDPVPGASASSSNVVARTAGVGAVITATPAKRGRKL